MFGNILTDVEVKAIARSRGFPVGGGDSRLAVKSLFLSPLGIEQALAGLTVEERVALHLLAKNEDAPDVSFFERVYHTTPFDFRTAYMLTYNQRYKDVLKTVRERLVRRGILIMDEQLMAMGGRMEHWTFVLPPVVRDLLPGVIAPARLPGPPPPDETHRAALDPWLLQLAGEPPSGPLANDPRARLSLKNGTIFAGSRVLGGGEVFEWMGNSWMKSITGRVLSSEGQHPVQAILDAVEGLAPGDWFLPVQIEPVLKVSSFGIEHPPAAEILEAGYRWGLFARRVLPEGTYYRYTPVNSPAAPGEEPVLENPTGGSVSLLGLAPALLVAINFTSRIELKARRLSITPDLQKIAGYYPNLKDDPTAQGLIERLPAYRALYQPIRENWGKNLIHTNLLVARITDLSLLVQLERALEVGVDYVRLGAEWVAFPRERLEAVEKVVKKANCIIKVVRP